MNDTVYSPKIHWDPCNDMLDNFKSSNYAVIVLNCRMHYCFPQHVILSLWKQAALRLTVDGGSRRWLDWMKSHNVDKDSLSPPELITGDMDSIEPDVVEYFRERNTEIVRTPDQDETDFTKALKVAEDYIRQHCLKVDTIYVLGDTSGRFDQIMANINSLFKANTFLPKIRIFQLASNSLTWLLQKGEHIIGVPANLRESKEWCALIPIGGACMVSTEGLQWNLDNSQLVFGGMVSTSNTYSGESEVKIKTDNSLIWSMGLESLMEGCC